MLHISDGAGRICIIETKTITGGNAVGSPTGIWRYQLSNHLGSATVEVDGSGAIISYEEYHPYGTKVARSSMANSNTAGHLRHDQFAHQGRGEKLHGIDGDSRRKCSAHVFPDCGVWRQDNIPGDL